MKAFSKNNTNNGTPTRSNLSGGESFFGVQAKLSVGKPDDKYEREADHMADQVVAKQQSSFFGGDNFFPATVSPSVQRVPFEEIQQKETEEEIQEKPLAESITPLVQMASDDEDVQAKCATCESEEMVQRLPFEKKLESPKLEENVQKKCKNCEQEESIQTKGGNGFQASGTVESQLRSSKGGGSSMGAQTRSSMESGFGADFSNVRIHTDSNAVRMSQALGAQAFTHGNDIYFNEGKYNPSSTSGQHLLAHELTHTIQQGGSGPIAQNKIQRWPAWADSAANWVADTATSAAGAVADGAVYVGGKVVDGAVWVGDKVSEGAEWVGDQVSEAADWLIEQFNSAIDSGTEFLNEKWEAIESFGTSSFEDIKGGFEVLSSFITTPLAFINAALSDMNADLLQGGWNLVKAGGNALMAGINAVIDTVLNAGEAIWGTVTGTIDGIFDTIDGLFDNTAFGLLPGFIKSGIRSAFNGLKSLWNRISSFWTDLWERLTSFVRDIVAAVEGFIENIISFGIEQVIAMVIKLKEVYNFVMDTLMDPEGTVSPIVNAMAGKISAEGPPKSEEFGNQWTHENYPGEQVQTQDNGTVQRAVLDGEERTTASLWEVLSGIWYYLGEAWKGLTFSKIVEMIWTSIKDLIWPWSAIGQQFVTLWTDDWGLMVESLYMPRNFLEDPLGCLHDIYSNYMILLDFPLALWRTLNNVIGLLMGWITIILMLVGAFFGGMGGAAFFGIAIPAGIGAGALAGLALMEPIGLILAGSIISAETNTATIVMGRLFTANQTCEKRQVDIRQAVSSAITAGVTTVVAVVMFLLSKFIAAIAEFLRGAPKTTPVQPPAPQPIPTPLPEPVPIPAQPRPIPQPVQPVAPPAQPMPPNVVPFPGVDVPPPANTPMPIPDKIAAKFEDDQEGMEKAQIALQADESGSVMEDELRGDREVEEDTSVQMARIDNINPDACDEDDDELPKTHVTNSMDGQGRAHQVTADPLTRLEGNTSGSDPTTDDAVPRGWPHVRSFDLFYDKKGILRVTNWVKFHLLHNKNMHGPGEGWNLVPAHKTDNSNYYSSFEQTMVNKLGPTSKGIYSFDVTVDSYREATEAEPYLSDFPVSLTINAKEYNDYHKDPTNTTDIFSGASFTFNVPPNRSRGPNEVPSFVMNNGGRPNLVKFTHLGEWGARQFAAIRGASSVDDIGRELVERPSTSRSQFETRLGYLRSVRDSIGPFYRNEVHEANVFLFSDSEDPNAVRGQVDQKVREYEAILRDNNHTALRSKFDEVVDADNGLNSNDVKQRIQDRFDISRTVVDNYLSGSTKPSPLTIRDIINYLNTL